MQRDFPALYWRTRPDNPIAAWYSTVCDGMVKRKQWHVFWRGLDTAKIPEIVTDAEARATDFQTLTPPPPAAAPAPEGG
jgi:acetylglutamate synthase